MLTREETGIAIARNLEVTHEVDGTVKTIKEITQDVDGNVKATQDLTQNIGRDVKSVIEVTQDVDGNVKAATELIRDVDGNVQALDDNVKVIEQVTHRVDDNVNKIIQGAQTSITFMHISTYHFLPKQSQTSLNVSYSLTLSPSIIEAETHSKRTSHARTFEHGSLLQILP
jgi:uncharacterized protein YoxC